MEIMLTQLVEFFLPSAKILNDAGVGCFIQICASAFSFFQTVFGS